MDALNRCAIGFRLPGEAVPALTDAQMELRRRGQANDMRWQPPGEMALVLVHLGEVRLDDMARALQLAAPVCAAAPAQLTFTLSGVHPDPNPTMPRAAYTALQGDTAVFEILRAELHKTLGSMANTVDPVIGIELGKVRSGSDKARAELGRAIKVLKVGDLATWTVDHAELFRAEATPTGPTWQTVQNLPFGG